MTFLPHFAALQQSRRRIAVIIRLLNDSALGLMTRPGPARLQKEYPVQCWI